MNKRVEIKIDAKEVDIQELVNLVCRKIIAGEWKNVNLKINDKEFIPENGVTDSECNVRLKYQDKVTGHDRSSFFKE